MEILTPKDRTLPPGQRVVEGEYKYYPMFRNERGEWVPGEGRSIVALANGSERHVRHCMGVSETTTVGGE